MMRLLSERYITTTLSLDPAVYSLKILNGFAILAQPSFVPSTLSITRKHEYTDIYSLLFSQLNCKQKLISSNF